MWFAMWHLGCRVGRAANVGLRFRKRRGVAEEIRGIWKFGERMVFWRRGVGFAPIYTWGCEPSHRRVWNHLLPLWAGEIPGGAMDKRKVIVGDRKTLKNPRGTKVMVGKSQGDKTLDDFVVLVLRTGLELSVRKVISMRNDVTWHKGVELMSQQDRFLWVKQGFIV